MRKLLIETIESLINYITIFNQNLSTIISEHRDGNEEYVIKLMPQVLEGIQWILDAIQCLQQHGYLRKIDISNITNHLLNIEHLMIIKDYYLIVDMFEFEITPIFESWILLLKELNID